VSVNGMALGGSADPRGHPDDRAGDRSIDNPIETDTPQPKLKQNNINRLLRTRRRVTFI
jgi:hypothetical protein